MCPIDYEIDRTVDELVLTKESSFDQAEKYLEERYKRAAQEGDRENAEYVLQKLAFLYSLNKDYHAAAKAYLRWEAEAAEPIFAKAEAAFFYFNIANQYQQALRKTEEIEQLYRSRTGDASPVMVRALFRGLHVKGRALLKVGRLSEVPNVLDVINRLVQENATIPLGFELDLIEECISEHTAVPECKTYLDHAEWDSINSRDFEQRKHEALRRLDALGE